MSSVALVVPAFRMYVVAVACFDEDCDDFGDEVSVHIRPILAIRSLVDQTGQCDEDFLILHEYEPATITTVHENYFDAGLSGRKTGGYRKKVVSCTWPSDQDEACLKEVADYLLGCEKRWREAHRDEFIAMRKAVLDR